MEDDFEQLIKVIDVSHLSPDVLHRITLFLKHHTDESWIQSVSKSLLILECWAWQLLSQYSHQWIAEPYYQELFYTLASFNKKLIFDYTNIEIETKASLLFSVTIDQINCIFKQIERSNDDNNPFISIVSLWFDNHSYFLQDNPHYNILPVIYHIIEYITRHYIVNEKFKFYLTQLRQSQLVPSIFTAKMLFYIKTCSFSLFSFLGAKADSCSYDADKILYSISDDYLEIIHIHSQNMESWSKELLVCMAHLISLATVCCWWDGQNTAQWKILFSSEQVMCNHVEDLTRIIAHKPFQKQIKSVRSNDETILIDVSLMMLTGIVHTQAINWFFRSNTTIQDILSTVAETSVYDEICLCAYGILGEVLTDEQLKVLKIADTISGFFFNMLEKAWYHPTKKYKQVPIAYLLRGFSNLSKNGFIQQLTADSNKVPLLIEMSDQYPIAFDIIWALSFNPVVQQQLRSSASFMSKLSHLAKDCDNEQMREITHGILWNLEINHEDHLTSGINDGKTFDVMISYSHKEKVLCKQLYEELTKAGYSVWIDFDQMHGNVMDAMAQAIERSSIIIICMSEHYRRSNYCRAEAHYAFQRQRKIVPVLLQKHYRPDGWLLFLIGQLLYVDFIKYEFALAMKMLMKELKAERIPDTEVSNVRPKENVNTLLPITSASSLLLQPGNILEWSKVDVHDWLIDHNLVEMTHLLANCDGRSLVYLSRHMKHGDPQEILTLLQADSLRRTGQVLSLIELSSFQSLIDQETRRARSTVSTRQTRANTNSDKRDS